MHPPRRQLRDFASAPLRANPREDLRTVKVEESSLVVAWRVKDEVVEPKVEVRTKLLQVLIGIVRDKPPSMRDVFHVAREPLHLSRIVDARLVIGGKSQGRPDLC